ncbi:hypothetical protein PVL29_007035 [Vitis rotundifolia]|uniref:Uncharacterized protein n=1 Tax=Vitis rotundifolia TaxID=103349 RepID=A0AA38ZYM3_VITRO|nr:hypothetical protein PVL29_007035 [Vitis rotundifolia]
MDDRMKVSSGHGRDGAEKRRMVDHREEEEAVAMKRLSSMWRGSMIGGATALLLRNEDAADLGDGKEKWR